MTKPLLFVQEGCPACQEVLKELKDSGVDVKKECHVVDCDTKSGSKKADDLGVQYTPTLVKEGKEYVGEKVVCGIKGTC